MLYLFIKSLFFCIIRIIEYFISGLIVNMLICLINFLFIPLFLIKRWYLARLTTLFLQNFRRILLCCFLNIFFNFLILLISLYQILIYDIHFQHTLSRQWFGHCVQNLRVLLVMFQVIITNFIKIDDSFMAMMYLKLSFDRRLQIKLCQQLEICNVIHNLYHIQFLVNTCFSSIIKFSHLVFNRF